MIGLDLLDIRISGNFKQIKPDRSIETTICILCIKTVADVHVS